MVSKPILDPDVGSVLFGPVGGVCPFGLQSHETQRGRCVCMRGYLSHLISDRGERVFLTLLTILKYELLST